MVRVSMIRLELEVPAGFSSAGFLAAGFSGLFMSASSVSVFFLLLNRVDKYQTPKSLDI